VKVSKNKEGCQVCNEPGNQISEIAQNSRPLPSKAPVNRAKERDEIRRYGFTIPHHRGISGPHSGTFFVSNASRHSGLGTDSGIHTSHSNVPALNTTFMK
jgi:hypothetical protein